MHGSKPIQNIIKIFKRDLADKFVPQQNDFNNTIFLDINCNYKSFLASEQFQIDFPSEDQLIIKSPDELGAIYGLLYISEQYLGIKPFGFWYDQVIEQVDSIKIPLTAYCGQVPAVRFRGWFVNDEVLLDVWNLDGSNEAVWKRVFETLLRCRRNMVIPGTDLNSKKHRKLAADMGLWITHHHAEPLGAEMFLRAYPDMNASYIENRILFEKLWEGAIIEQKDTKVVWNVGFRGQGDKAFWHDDSRFSTPEERGQLISQVIERQCELVRKHVKEPVFCTNLYGEILELYAAGYIKIPNNVIKIWGDSGYGKMVSRRQGNHNPRHNALAAKDDQGLNGIYYHASFYDLQASSHITMIPNSPEFLYKELSKCLQLSMDQYWIINCGNVKPHSYILDLIKELWLDGSINIDTHLHDFLSAFYCSEFINDIAKVLKEYFNNTIHYGVHNDEKAGEQFYHHPARIIISSWIKGETEKTVSRLYWATGDIGFENQVQWFKVKCTAYVNKWESLLCRCNELAEKLSDTERKIFEAMLAVQVKIHYSGCKGLMVLCESFQLFQDKQYAQAFVYAADAMNEYAKGVETLERSEYGHWKGFYDNDCLTNVRLTVYYCDSLRRYIRMVGDSPNFHTWERKYLYDPTDKNIVLLTNTRNHLNDDELYLRLKQYFRN